MSKTELINYKPPEVSSVRKKDDMDGECDILRISVKGVNDYLSFNIDFIPQEHRVWLQNILTNHFTEVAEKSFELGRQSVIKNMKVLLELK